MMEKITVGKLKKALENVPDDLEVELSSDTGVDDGPSEVIVNDARRVKYTSIYDVQVDKFVIYADYNEEE